jgi:hypothetical protein
MRKTMMNWTINMKDKDQRGSHDLEVIIFKLKNYIKYLEAENKELHKQIEELEEKEDFTKGFN